MPYGQIANLTLMLCIFKTATNPNNIYSSGEAYITDRRLYTCMACNC